MLKRNPFKYEKKAAEETKSKQKKANNNSENLQLDKLPFDVYWHLTKFLGPKDLTKLMQVNKFFNLSSDHFYQVWQIFKEEIVAAHPVFDTTAMTFADERRFCKLMRHIMMTALSGKSILQKSETEDGDEIEEDELDLPEWHNWLAKNPELISVLGKMTENSREVLKEATNDTTTSSVWDLYIKKSMDHEDIFEEKLGTLLLNFNLQWLKSKGDPLNEELQNAAALLLNYICREFDFFSNKVFLNFTMLFSERERQKVRRAVLIMDEFLQNNNNEKIAEEKMHSVSAALIVANHLNRNELYLWEAMQPIKMELWARCFNMMNKDIPLIKYQETLKEKLIATLKMLCDPHCPSIKYDKEKGGFNIWWKFKEIELKDNLAKLLKSMDLNPKYGKSGNIFSVQLLNVEPVEILVAYEKFKNVKTQEAKNIITKKM